MAIVDGDILRVSCNFELGNGTQYQNVYYYIRDGDDPYSDAAHVSAIKARIEDMYDELAGLVLNDVVEQLSFVDRVAFNEVESQWRVVENVGTFTPVFTPSEAGDGLPHQNAPYVIFKTLRPRTVAKKFLFPVSEAQQDEGILIAGAVTAVTAYAAQTIASLALGGDATLTPHVVRTGVQSSYNLLVAVVSDVIGSQRRRKPGVGA